MKRFYILTLFAIVLNFAGIAQIANNMCEGALPFCTGSAYSFPAGTGSPTAQVGPFYSCLGSTPNPAWYYMKIAIPGMIQITMHSQPSYDIDFCLWGPFDSQNVCGQLTSNKVIDCSYSTAATEVVDIPNAILGKYYILIITNYSNQPCNIIFSQTGGTGVTDCTILPPAAANDGPLCVGEMLHLTAANMNNAVYHWVGPDGWSSNIQNPTRLNVQPAMAGMYSMFVTINGVPSADTNHTNVAIFNKPTATLSGGGDICMGDSTALTLTCQNHPPWSVTYTTNGANPTTIGVNTSPYIFYVHPTTSTTYKATQVSNEICNGLASGTVTVNVNAKPVPDFTLNNYCSGFPTQFTDISSVFGGYVTSWFWNFGMGLDTSNLQNPTFTYSDGGTYNVMLKVISNNGCTSQLIKPVVINPTPTASAGYDRTIPFGTCTSLQGEAYGGSGNYTTHWEPADKLVNPNILNPTTVNLTTSTDYTLTVVDAGNACQQSDIATVTVTGGALAVQIAAEPSHICKGANTSINLQPGGGSGNYTFSWSSNPAGFSSTMEDITVQPTVTTAYTVLVNDGFSVVTKTTTITVYDNPTIDAGTDQTIPFGTSTTLNGFVLAGTQPYTYAWNPSSLLVSPTLMASSTTILTSTTIFTFQVTDGHGCSSTNQTLVTITGGALMVNPEAQRSPICIGESTTLHPLSEGGSGNYTYTWTADNGFLSNDTDPVVSPTQTITYHLTISDGFTASSDTVTLIVNPLPVVNLIPAEAHAVGNDTIMACVFDTVTLNAAGQNLSYLWSNGATTPMIQSTTTGIAFDMLHYSVTVFNTLTGCSNSGELTIIYSYEDCSYGIAKDSKQFSCMVYPNPGTGLFTCKVHLEKPDANGFVTEIINSQGMVIGRNQVVSQSGNDNSFALDITAQPSGVYFLKIYNSDFLRIVKIVKY